MDYEELYQQMQGIEKNFKDRPASAQKTFKSLTKGSEKGEFRK